MDIGAFRLYWQAGPVAIHSAFLLVGDIIPKPHLLYENIHTATRLFETLFLQFYHNFFEKILGLLAEKNHTLSLISVPFFQENFSRLYGIHHP